MQVISIGKSREIESPRHASRPFVNGPETKENPGEETKGSPAGGSSKRAWRKPVVLVQTSSTPTQLALLYKD